MDSVLPNWLAILPPLARAGGFAWLVPMLGADAGQWKCRVVLAILLALVLLPCLPPGAATDDVASIAPELVVGFAAGALVGLLLRAVLNGVSLVGQLVDLQLGLPAAIDPDDDGTGSVLSRLYQLVAVAVFFEMGGHRLVVAGLLDGPHAADFASGDAVQAAGRAADLLGIAFLLTLRLAVPVVLALVSANLAVAMIARVLPQFSGSAFGTLALLVGGLLLVAISLGAIEPGLWKTLAVTLDGVAR